MTTDAATVYVSTVSSQIREGQDVQKRCYYSNVSLHYNVSRGVSLSNHEALTLMRRYVRPLLLNSMDVKSGCRRYLTLTTGQVFASPPGRANIAIGASFTFAASKTIQDDGVQRFLLGCMQTMTCSAWDIQQRAPKLNVNGVLYSTNNVSFSSPRSCCGAKPPPCYVHVLSSHTTILGTILSIALLLL